ncbi:GumC family protein [Leptolyngbya ohadii]|uniref:GumC family protein n=1 Tax=Leptolyngbya ohadii TaxID=1962290 RepID=UPI000B59A7CF|nr:polysaccharide biosynthesis tyrosine autokinase [Leptolyngbya ohadii]
MVPENHSDGIDLQQYWMTLRRHWLAAGLVFSATVAMCATITLLQKPTYRAGGQLLLKVDPLSRLTGVISPEIESEIADAAEVSTEAEVVQSIPFIQSVISSLNLVDESGKALTVEAFRQKLDVKTVRGTSTIRIAFEASNPKEAAEVVNKLLNLYLERNKLNNRAEATAAREFIEKQLPETLFRVQQTSAALKQFKQQNQFVAADDEAKAFSTTLQKLQENINATQAALSNSRARTISLQNQLNIDPSQAIILGSLSQAPGVQKPLEQLQDIQDQLAVARVRYRESAPLIISLRQKEEELRKLLQQRMSEVIGEQVSFQGGEIQIGALRENLIQELIKSEVDRYAFENQLATLTNQYSAQRQRAVILADLEQTQRQLALNLDAAQSTYETLLKRLQEVRLAENQNIGNAQIIESALVPEKPVSPKKLLNLIAGSAIGVILGILTAFILDYRDNTIKTSSDAKAIFRFPTLGVIPDFGKSSGSLRKNGRRNSFNIPVRDNPQSFISEIYRMIFTNLRHFHAGQNVKVVAVTSSIAGEGKSTLAANLALAASEACNKTLLIDADLRRSSQHTMWGITSSFGLADVLSGQVELQEAVQRVKELDILPAGNLSSNSLALLTSQRMRHLIQALTQSYDFVVIDTPPLLVSADTSVIGKATDGILMVVRPGVIARQNAASAQELLQQSGQRVLGQVVNAADLAMEADNQPYYNQDYYEVGQSLLKNQEKFNVNNF